MKRKLVFLIFGVMLLSTVSFWSLMNYRHDQELVRLIEEEKAVQDSLITYIQELTTALDIFTDSKPMVFTAYNAMVSQTDDTPNITASNKEIFPGVLALSRELLKPYGFGGNIAYGDTVWVVLPMQVEDTMHRRWRSRGDVFMLDYDEAIQFGKRNGRMYTPSVEEEWASLLEPPVRTLN